MIVNPRILKYSAERTILNAYNDALVIKNNSVLSETFVSKIILGQHKTFRYILFTALLAKASNESVNPLALQSGADLIGAYDARSLCHSVVVPFEQKYLDGALGGSNEPYLNKPARFTQISKSNPVRAGKDREIQILMCDELSKISSSGEAYEFLVEAMRLLVSKRNSIIPSIELVVDPSSRGYIRTVNLINRILEESSQGEMLNLAVSSALRYFFDHDESIEVQVHKANQSGASSREISDLDIYKNDNILALYELKDKRFSVQDILHAVNKARDSSCESLNFIAGRGVPWDLDDVGILCEELFADGFILNVFSVDDFIFPILDLIEDCNIETMSNILDDVIRDSNASGRTRDLISYILTTV